jgi:hypothetical protein
VTVRWNGNTSEFLENRRVDAFLEDLFDLCEKHGLWLSHEDTHGAFVVTDEDTSEWIADAAYALKEDSDA